MAMMLLAQSHLVRRREESGGCGAFGCFFFLLFVGVIIFLVMRGRRDKAEQLGASKRPMGSASVEPHSFACPYAKCPSCGAAGDRMKQQWDGFRQVTWTCGYCGSQAGVQELRDDELPPSARQRLGLDGAQGMMPGADHPGGYGGGMGSGVGGLLTGMMIGNMMGGGSHHTRNQDGWGGGSSGDDWGGGGSTGGDWGDSGDSGGDWGDGGDSGGDCGGGDD